MNHKIFVMSAFSSGPLLGNLGLGGNTLGSGATGNTQINQQKLQQVINQAAQAQAAQAQNAYNPIPSTIYQDDYRLKQLYAARESIATEIKAREAEVYKAWDESQAKQRKKTRLEELKRELAQLEAEAEL